MSGCCLCQDSGKQERGETFVWRRRESFLPPPGWLHVIVFFPGASSVFPCSLLARTASPPMQLAFILGIFSRVGYLCGAVLALVFRRCVCVYFFFVCFVESRAERHSYWIMLNSVAAPGCWSGCEGFGHVFVPCGCYCYSTAYPVGNADCACTRAVVLFAVYWRGSS